MANLKQIPLTCSGHTRPVVHLDFSDIIECGYFLISACKGKLLLLIFHYYISHLLNIFTFLLEFVYNTKIVCAKCDHKKKIMFLYSRVGLP